MAIVSDTFGKLGIGSGSLSGITQAITILVLIAIFAIIFGGLLFYFINLRRYKYKIVVFENVAGQGYAPSFRDKARIDKIGDSGEEILYLKKKKVWRQAYGRKIGKNEYAFAIGNDGYWYNITFGDLDKARQELGLSPIDRDMRYMHVAIRRNTKDRFDQVTFLQKYGGLIAYISLIAVTGILQWLLFKQYIDAGNAAASAVNAAADLINRIDGLLAKVDIISSGGSGIKPA